MRWWRYEFHRDWHAPAGAARLNPSLARPCHRSVHGFPRTLLMLCQKLEHYCDSEFGCPILAVFARVGFLIFVMESLKSGGALLGASKSRKEPHPRKSVKDGAPAKSRQCSK